MTLASVLQLTSLLRVRVGVVDWCQLFSIDVRTSMFLLCSPLPYVVLVFLLQRLCSGQTMNIVLNSLGIYASSIEISMSRASRMLEENGTVQ